VKTAALLLLMTAPVRAGEFRFRDLDAKSLELSEDGRPVLVYNHGTMLKDGVPADRARCCYIHPLYAPNGAVLTDDFPRDHYHHRGVSWMWPVVKVQGKTYDLWTIKGIAAKFDQWIRKDAASDRATLAVRNGWYIGDRKVVEEEVEVVVFPSTEGRRKLNFTLRFRAVADGVELAGSPDANKGYGGFNVRFAPRTGTTIRTPDSQDARDSDSIPQAWAELSGDFGGRRAALRIVIDPGNPASPNGWCLRHYGFLGVEFPGLSPHTLRTGEPMVLKYSITTTTNTGVPPIQ
jgi:hypothetical protein